MEKIVTAEEIEKIRKLIKELKRKMKYGKTNR